MIDILKEKLEPLAMMASRIPPARGAKKTALSTILRWILAGTKAPSGETVRLEAIRLGGRWMTSQEALQRFIERLTPEVRSDAPVTRSPARRERASRRAEQELERIGI
jgi:hypothetical protein